MKRLIIALILMLFPAMVFAGGGALIKPSSGVSVPFDTSAGVSGFGVSSAVAGGDIACVWCIPYGDDVQVTLDDTKPTIGSSGVGGNGFTMQENVGIPFGPFEASAARFTGHQTSAGHVQCYLYPVWVAPPF